MKSSLQKESNSRPVKPPPPPAKETRPAASFLALAWNECWGVLVILVAVALLYSMLPLGTAVRFGGDEGYELMKGFLVSKGFKLYKQIWCDQTPLFPMLLSWAFRTCGPVLLVARLIAAGFGLLLFGTFFQLVRQTAGQRAAFIAAFLLLASPIILELSVSVMQEVPAFAVALASILLLFRRRQSPRRGWLLASGAVMGIAIGIKVTAAIIVPAVLAEIAVAQSGKSKLFDPRRSALEWGQWLAAMGVLLIIILLLWGDDSIRATWQTQSFAPSPDIKERPGDFSFSAGLLADHCESVAAAILGLMFISWLRRWRDFVLPITWLFTAFAVHLVHRPWWDYYYLHLAIPMAWLAGFALNECIARILKSKTGGQLAILLKQPFRSVAMISFTAFVLVRSEGRLESEMKNLRQRERTSNSQLLAKIRQYAPETHWIYVQSGMEQYAFEAQLSMPPEIAVIAFKRFWSGQISETKIINMCRQYRPEQILMNSNNITENWNSFLVDYTNEYQERGFPLYLRK